MVSNSGDVQKWWLGVVLAAMGCTSPMIELETESGESGSNPDTSNPGTTTDTAADETGPPTDDPLPALRASDIIFVVDNSGSMGEEQGALGLGIEQLIATLDQASPPVDYRIAVTTTDDGNPWCQGSTPEAGNFRSTSCRTRPDEFVFNGAQVIDAFNEACLNFCELEQLDLSEPWVDVSRSTGTTNVPGDQVLETLSCMLPQGINGCGFEKPLESLSKAIRRAEVSTEPSFGFLRPGALLTVILLTDEGDCSYNEDHESIFLPEGGRVFWSDPDTPAPTSAVCWNAGVQCTGSGPYECSSADLDVNAEIASNPEQDAVLHPISRYVEELSSYGAYVSAINGVASDGTVIYADTITDPDFQNNFGIGPGCESPSARAVPPVRVREVIETVTGPGNLYSVCEPSYGAALGAIGEGIIARLP